MPCALARRRRDRLCARPPPRPQFEILLGERKEADWGDGTGQRIFGELALIKDAPRLAGAVALERTVCEVIRKELFDGVIQSMPPILRALTKIYVTQLSTVRRKEPEAALERFPE